MPASTVGVAADLEVRQESTVSTTPIGQTASTNANFTAGTTITHNSSRLTIVIRMLVGELNRRVRRKPMKPVVFTGAGRSGTRSWRTKCDVVSLIRPCSD